MDTLRIDKLPGKQVRITYVDGVGVESTAPVGCALLPDEHCYI
jgi:hypothetical protein